MGGSEDDEVMYGDSVYIDYRKFSVCSRVEHTFHIIKNCSGFNKVSYCGIIKNLNRMNVLCVCANLLIYAQAKKHPVQTVG